MENRKSKKGYIHVYTGRGKGKTTAALGLAFRALGSGYKVYIGQFMKGQNYSETKAADKFEGNLVIEQFGQPTFVHVENPTKKDVQLASQGLARMEEAIQSGDYDIIVFDEVNVALHFNLISLNDVLRIIDNRPPYMEIICTGRSAPRELLARADLVTEMKEKKHYFYQGVQAREGIEM